MLFVQALQLLDQGLFVVQNEVQGLVLGFQNGVRFLQSVELYHLVVEFLDLEVLGFPVLPQTIPGFPRSILRLPREEHGPRDRVPLAALIRTVVVGPVRNVEIPYPLVLVLELGEGSDRVVNRILSHDR